MPRAATSVAERREDWASRVALTVVLVKDTKYPDTQKLEAFSGGAIVSQVGDMLDANMEFRIASWRVGDAAAWNEWKAECGLRRTQGAHHAYHAYHGVVGVEDRCPGG